ncbi:hypothetical protein M440DRAFT_566 [Trichoderma longibrachiatum ATCC 18648]|uniref:Uncharacterized protein n=1 Tax=Trichoderma longibrachiatum ATCC 18648 TaxID=983965 RepID=A0A2T4CIW6_TRILO|nr:hypothetical protein M440DRAFT_566 [Trichoderma longibrachiatum ATCC 18648]
MALERGRPPLKDLEGPRPGRAVWELEPWSNWSCRVLVVGCVDALLCPSGLAVLGDDREAAAGRPRRQRPTAIGLSVQLKRAGTET